MKFGGAPVVGALSFCTSDNLVAKQESGRRPISTCLFSKPLIFPQTSDFDADPTLPKSSVRFTSRTPLSGFYGIVLPTFPR
jgi:hypothetical protein